MKSKFWSVLTVLVAVVLVLGLVAAVSIPSLLRARGPASRMSMTPPPLRMPAPTSAVPSMLAEPSARQEVMGFEDKATPGRRTPPSMNTDAYERIVDNAFLAVATSPLSTFSIDVDTASYANVRRFLTGGQKRKRPPASSRKRGGRRPGLTRWPR